MRKIETPEQLNALINAILKIRESASDENALVSKELYPSWEPDTEYEADNRLYYNDKLYKVRQAHISQAIYPPSIDTAALYTEITLEPGTRDHPIPYNNNMELEAGKYYSQNEVVYLCIRSTGVPVYNNLADLVHIYVEVAE